MTNKIKVTDFDFDTIKMDFKSYLKTRPEFTDYNFEGSNLNVLLDLLAYNTHYHALMANFLSNEMFLDTAAKRSSVVSHSKTLGYVPKSKTASKATVNLFLTFKSNASSSSYVLPRGIVNLKTNIDGTNYTFTTANNYSSAVVQDLNDPTKYNVSFEDVVIYEGEYTTTTEVYDELLKFITIKNLDIDLSTLIVAVRDPQKETYENYVYAKNLLDISDSKVYFIQEGYDGKFQIYFGDGVFGTSPIDKSIVKLSYVVTHGAAANGAKQWIMSNPDSTLMSSEFSHEDITGLSIGGSNRESIESIKFNSINNFGAQNRAVVASDYAVLAQQFSDNIKTVSAWGGEDEVPPLYNSVVLCAIPNQGEDLTNNEKASIEKYLKTKAVGTTNIIFKSPQYLDLQLNVTFTYNSKLINLSVFELESTVRDYIGKFAKDYLYNFSSSFKESKFLTTLDRINDSITGTSIFVNFSKDITIQPYTQQTHIINFSNPIDTTMKTSAISSTGFYTNKTTSICYLSDDRQGNINIVSYDSLNNVKIISEKVGLIDYELGQLSATLYITYIDGPTFKIYAHPKYNNVTSSRNNILRIKNDNITVMSKGE